MESTCLLNRYKKVKFSIQFAWLEVHSLNKFIYPISKKILSKKFDLIETFSISTEAVLHYLYRHGHCTSGKLFVSHVLQINPLRYMNRSKLSNVITTLLDYWMEPKDRRTYLSFTWCKLFYEKYSLTRPLHINWMRTITLHVNK